jgi:hypothetical protein
MIKRPLAPDRTAVQLKISIPQQTNDLPSHIDPRAGPTTRWLNDLPALDPSVALERIHARLVTLNRAVLKPTVRLQGLDLLRTRIGAATGLLDSRSAHAALPMRNRQRIAAELIKAVNLELAYGYKAAIVDLSSGGGGERELATAIHRAMRCTTQLLLAHYASYTPEPEGIWQELHHLRRVAEALGLSRQPIDDSAAKVGSRTSIKDCYKHALLLGLCKPYQLEARALRRTDTYLERWAGLARIRKGSQSLSPHCQFVLCDDCDRPDAPRVQRKPTGSTPPQPVLDTQELVAKLNLQLTALRAGIPPELDGLPAELFDAQSRPLLHHLILSWGVIPARSFSRVHTANELRIAVGIEPVADALRAAAGGAAPSGAFAGGRCQVVDEGAGGLGVAVTDTGALSLRVGDVICTAAADAPTVGLIRWMKIDHDERIRLGIQKLCPFSAPAVVNAVQPDAERATPPYRALALPAFEPLHQPRSVLTTRGVFHPRRNLILESAHDLKMIRADRLVERTACLDWFEYEDLKI